jgi:hypothetical protein
MTAPAGRRALRRAAVFGVLAALFWGGWAFYVNAGAGVLVAARSAAAQALVSFTVTLAMSLVVERLFRAGRTPWQGFWIGSLGTVSINVGAITTVHALAGTPRILATAGPSIALGSTFVTVYAWGLMRSTRADLGRAVREEGR